eukprot:1159703-Pelagomonas_calceolata.AAC.1
MFRRLQRCPFPLRACAEPLMASKERNWKKRVTYLYLPTRAALLTKKWPQKCGIGEKGREVAKHTISGHVHQGKDTVDKSANLELL